MKKLLPLLFILIACASEKEPESPRAEIARMQNELKREYKMLEDSFRKAPLLDANQANERQYDSLIRAEAQYNRRMMALERRSDSLSNVMKRWQADSIIRVNK